MPIRVHVDAYLLGLCGPVWFSVRLKKFRKLGSLEKPREGGIKRRSYGGIVATVLISIFLRLETAHCASTSFRGERGTLLRPMRS